MLLSSLTSLPLPPVRLAALGLLGAVIGFPAPAREAGAERPAAEGRTAVPVISRGMHDDAAFFGGPGVADLSQRAFRISSVGAPPPVFEHNPDGTTHVIIRWDYQEGETSGRRSVRLVVPTRSIPEPTFPFLGACAGCVVLLHRRRAKPSKLRVARVNLFTAGLPRIRSAAALAQAEPERSRASAARRASAQAPRKPSAPPAHRLLACRVSGTAPLLPRSQRTSGS